MPDGSLEILVKMTADTSGGQLVKKELQETKAQITDGLDPAVAHYGAQTEAATKSVEGMGVSHREMTKVREDKGDQGHKK